MTRVFLRYFAVLKDCAQKTGETRSTSASSAAELYRELQRCYGFTVPDTHIRVAINERFESMNYRLQADDRVAFIPPVTGG